MGDTRLIIWFHYPEVDPTTRTTSAAPVLFATAGKERRLTPSSWVVRGMMGMLRQRLRHMSTLKIEDVRFSSSAIDDFFV
ncbi:hypothetical protein LCGC14_3095110, partial [marine sediment metagenome]